MFIYFFLHYAFMSTLRHLLFQVVSVLGNCGNRNPDNRGNRKIIPNESLSILMRFYESHFFPENMDLHNVSEHIVQCAARISRSFQGAGFSESVSNICSMCIVRAFKANSRYYGSEGLSEQKAVILSIVLLSAAGDDKKKRNDKKTNSMLNKCTRWLCNADWNKDIFRSPSYGLSVLRNHLFQTRSFYEPELEFLLDIPANKLLRNAVSELETYGFTYVNLELAVLPILGVLGSKEFAESVRELAAFFQ